MPVVIQRYRSTSLSDHNVKESFYKRNEKTYKELLIKTLLIYVRPILDNNQMLYYNVKLLNLNSLSS